MARRGTAARSRSILANGSDSPDSSRTGQRDVRPVRDPRVGPLGRPGRMERIAEQHEAGVRRVRLGGGQARDAAAERVATDGDVGASRDDQVEGGQGLLGPALGQVDRGGRDASRQQPVDERGHAGRCPARAVPEIATQTHGAQGSPARRRSRRSRGRSGAVRGTSVMVRSGHGRDRVLGRPSSIDPPSRGTLADRPDRPDRPDPPAARRTTRPRSSRSGRDRADRRRARQPRRALESPLGRTRRAPAHPSRGRRGSSRTPRRRTPPPGPTVLGPTVQLFGRGYGHGVGMSQYGARGRALAGQDAAAILAHYYRGRNSARSPRRARIRVRILLDWKATAAAPLIIYGRLTPWTIDGIAQTFPTDAVLRLIPTTAGQSHDVAAAGDRAGRHGAPRRAEAGQCRRPGHGQHEPARARRRSRRRYDQYRGVLRLRASVDRADRHGRQRAAARDLSARRGAGRDAVELAGGGARGRRPSPAGRTRRAGSGPASPTTT